MSEGPRAGTFPADASLTRQLTGFRSPILWGVLLLVTIEGILHVLFVVSYLYLRLGTEVWPPAGAGLPDLLQPTLSQALLLASVIPIGLALRSLPHGRMGPLLVGLPVGLALAAAHLGLKLVELGGKPYLWDAHAYGSLDWSMTGYAGLHVAVVLLAGAVIWILALRGHFGAHRYTGVQALALYWAFVVAASFLFYATQYLSPHLL